MLAPSIFTLAGPADVGRQRPSAVIFPTGYPMTRLPRCYRLVQRVSICASLFLAGTALTLCGAAPAPGGAAQILGGDVQTGGGTRVFFEPGFPSAENGRISRTTLEHALSPLHARIIGLAALENKDSLSAGDLLILPYGSAFPADAWGTIRAHADHGNLLVIGGRPFTVPVFRDGSGWRIDSPQATFSRELGIQYSYAAPQHGPWKFRWDEDAPWTTSLTVNPRRVFVNAGWGGMYRGLAYMVNDRGDRLAAPLVADDYIGPGQTPRRRVYCSAELDSTFWDSGAGAELMRDAATYASYGGSRIWLDFEELALDPGEHVTGAVDVVRTGTTATLKLELFSGSDLLDSRSAECGDMLHGEIGLTHALSSPGLYRVRATLTQGGTVIDRYTSGICVRDPRLIRSGGRLEAGRDYFTRGGRPYLMVGANYFCTDPYTSGFFVGGSIGGNAWDWERDFSDMERQGLTVVRTGIWLNRARYLDPVSGAADERLLRAVEAYLDAAARHHMEVIFTLFAFDPQTVMQQGRGEDGNVLGPGSNPYIDPVAIASEASYVRSIASRFKDVPFLSYDLINEPSFSNPHTPWRGNKPNGDPAETAAWRRWLRSRYTDIGKLSQAWRTPAFALGAFESVPLPAAADLDLARSGNTRNVRAIDYNLFAQDEFSAWADSMIHAIRSSGGNQPVTVGQDEGGVSDRVLNQFWAHSDVAFTVDHTWWRDDALLWNSVVAKSLVKPNIIGETGPQPVWAVDGSWRWDDVQGLPLVERKFALGFAAANAGVIHWDWSRSDDFGLLRRDGSLKQWIEPLSGIAAFARKAEPYATTAQLPEIALVLPQSLQMSVFSSWSVAAQQNAVRALFNYARATAFAVGEYQLPDMPDAKLIIVPSPWVMHEPAWETLMGKVRAGATLLLSGRIDLDEHWAPVAGRTQPWNAGYSAGALVTREATLTWPGDSARLSFSGDRTTYADRGYLEGGKTFVEVPLGSGKILYSALPLELADQLDAVARVYSYAIRISGARLPYETTCQDPGVLISPTRLPEATLYVLTSESATAQSVKFRDGLSGAEISVNLAPGRAALLLVGKDGHLISTYNAE